MSKVALSVLASDNLVVIAYSQNYMLVQSRSLTKYSHMNFDGLCVSHVAAKVKEQAQKNLQPVTCNLQLSTANTAIRQD